MKNQRPHEPAPSIARNPAPSVDSAGRVVVATAELQPRVAQPVLVLAE
jgi:hypothetical protein